MKALCSLQAEEALIGSMILDNDVLDMEAADLRPEDFYAPAHRTVWLAAMDLHSKGDRVDVVSLHDHLGEDGLRLAGGVERLTSFTSKVFTAANAETYAKIVRSWSAKRAIAHRCRMALATLEDDPHVDPTLLTTALTKDMDAVSATFVSKRCTKVGDRLKGWFVRLEAKMQGTTPPGVSTGYPDLDKILGRLGPDRLIILAARPAMGKTSLAQMIATHVASTAGAVYFSSLEMSTEDLIDRQISQQTRLDVTQVASGDIPGDEVGRVIQALAATKRLPLYYDDDPDATISAVCARARAQHRQVEGGLKLVVVDYLQLVMGDKGSSDKDFDVISATSRRLKLLAKELGVPVLCLAQLNRGVESRQDKRPMLSDLRGSGRIEEDADQICFVYRDEYYHADSDAQGLAEVITAKNRHGRTGTTVLRFRPACVRFESMARAYEEGER